MILEDCSLNLCSLSLYITDMAPVIEVAPMVSSFFQGVINI